MKRTQRLRVVIRGAVQGVGFRPFVYKLATALSLYGWVVNSSQGVFIEVEGEPETLEQFLLRLDREKPAHAFIQSQESTYLDAAGFQTFEIRKSSEKGEKTVLVLPDIATCPQCLQEIFDPANRRYLYPFTNCTLCGPRYTIIDSLPYDRPGTSMKGFPMCPDCLGEYEDPGDRRFHAQPNACPVCGPQVYASDKMGRVQARNLDAIRLVAQSLKSGMIVAVKGLGGFHLMVDARQVGAVETLRNRKRRSEKPFAIMMKSISEVERECSVHDLERRLLESSESPIVLLNRRTNASASQVADTVAPGNPTLGVMLPYTPLHHILLREIDAPLVATSGNVSDEPICIEETEALIRLSDIADLFLFHNRPIVRQVDDSVVRVMAGRELVLRRARGYAPLPVALTKKGSSVLAVGAHQKSTVALRVGLNAIVSQHLGDLETEQSYLAFQSAIESLQSLYEIKPQRIIADIHPDYLSSRYARETELPEIKIQHHHAHIASCMAENQLTGTVLGVAWDGTGAGLDDTIWGGEFLSGNEEKMSRVATLKKFRLPGSSQAVKEPRRSAAGLLFAAFGPDLMNYAYLPPLQAFTRDELRTINQVLECGFNSPYTSSAGRLFDAVSSLIGFRQVASYEGQGAMELEFAAAGVDCSESYSFLLSKEINWVPMISEIIADWKQEIQTAVIAAKFHNTMVEFIVAVAKKEAIARVVLSGGCFQNRYLTEKAIFRLTEEGFHPYWHQRIPPNDGGISLGQIYAGG